MDEDEAAMFRHCIRAMDAAFMKSIRDEPEAPETADSARDAFRAAFKSPPVKKENARG